MTRIATPYAFYPWNHLSWIDFTDGTDLLQDLTFVWDRFTGRKKLRTKNHNIGTEIGKVYSDNTEEVCLLNCVASTADFGILVGGMYHSALDGIAIPLGQAWRTNGPQAGATSSPSYNLLCAKKLFSSELSQGREGR